MLKDAIYKDCLMKLIWIVLAGVVACLGIGLLTTLYLSWRILKENPAEGDFVKVEGGSLHVLQQGKHEEGQTPSEQEAIVLLHGASSNASDLFNALGPSLAGQYVIAFDRPGHGWSDRLSPQADTLGFQARSIIKGLDALGVKQAVFVGHSFAGAIALRIGLDYPERVKATLLLGPASHPWTTGVAWYYHVASSPFGALLNYTFITPLGTMLIDKGVRAVFAPQIPPADYIKKAKIALTIVPEAFRANAEDMVALTQQLQEQQRLYPCYKPPLTIIMGKDDKIVSPVIHARTLAKQIPHALLIEMDHTGHLPHYADPEHVTDEILKLTGPQSGLHRSAALSNSSDCRN
jgi:pimeloyl-ACP methyl ester carboxylesterase